MDCTKYYVFYDGDCGFCNFWVQWILNNDRNDRFLFAALQSAFGQKFLKERGLKHKDFDTIYLWKPNSFYLVKSEAILKIAEVLGGRYSILPYFVITPKFLNDKIYALISKNRKLLAKNSCLIPSEKDRGKFLH